MFLLLLWNGFILRLVPNLSVQQSTIPRSSADDLMHSCPNREAGGNSASGKDNSFDFCAERYVLPTQFL